jgi:HD-GYP domain-containing protein (c-di-GMP phosphodiesterase class II)
MVIEMRNHGETTFLHSLDVFLIGTVIGIAFNAKPFIFSRACLLHDVGKIDTPLSVLQKNGKLTSKEREIKRTHIGSLNIHSNIIVLTH